VVFRLDATKAGPPLTANAFYMVVVTYKGIASHVCGVIAAGNGNVRVSMTNCVDDEGRNV